MAGGTKAQIGIMTCDLRDLKAESEGCLLCSFTLVFVVSLISYPQLKK